MLIPKIDLSTYEYTLPEDRIAKFPLEKRDLSKLLQFKNGEISHHHFFDLPDLLSSDSLLVYNDTKVIPARLIFLRDSGARIEVFLLQPLAPSTVIPEVMLSRHPVLWETIIGNLKKWKDGEVLKGKIPFKTGELTVEARLMDREKKLVELSWSDYGIPFVDVVEASGEVPLPPYLNRKPDAMDKFRYQTVYSSKEGAVAAPTAGLHFTDQVFDRLRKKGIEEATVTLHVSAGTFQPIKAEDVTEHPMHREQLVIEPEMIQKLLKGSKDIVAVGTTSVRTLESLYWYGVKLIEGKGEDFHISKLFPYEDRSYIPALEESLEAILNYIGRKGIQTLYGSTEIFIFPGYSFHMIRGLITNFHQPGSTLILLIASILGDDWKKIYNEALENRYRFLSYGDSSLIWID